MALYVNTNVSSLNAQRQLMTSTGGLDKSFERLSSGFRINSAADDAAGMQIVSRMTSQIEGLNQAVRNANDGISLAQTAEGALQETTTALQRMRQLAVQAQNGINSSEDLNALNKEVSALQSEITRIASNSEFAGIKVLDGELSASFLVGANAGQTIDVIAKNTNGFSAGGLSVDGANVSVSTTAGAASALASIDAALSVVNGARADLGAIQNRFQSTIRNLTNISENVSAAQSRIQDTDFAAETAKLTKFQIMQQASTTILAQANQRPQAALSLLG
ncbi:flagellin [Pseudidiomarina planktonica]|uniref:Flagellin n=1 Tax=Pseudidiomarina planktonica TaxID=1323738 RepID=A0A1Y6EIC0_9GAMM|nr:flagellin [Pseudidiomarina planktonica]RUO65876.1 flagellin FliC [Pseudidiomarina planktonica]SMQ62119.1 flagellin [Pseudidiomarina planktonica]